MTSDATHREKKLRARWQSATTAAGAPADRDPAPYADRLLTAWAEPQRKFHTTAHLADVLARIDVLAAHTADDADAPNPAAPNPAAPDTAAPDTAAIELAAWFHDAVYRPDRSENEERSAALAERALPELGIDAATTAEVARLVRLTVTHDPAPGDTNGEVLCDADLAVLAGTPAEYAAYAAAVRAEYGFVPDGAFRDGRAAVLRQLLALPRLFRTPYGAAHWEAPARANLAAELERLISHT
ncbi:hypothetical protein J7E97_05600 [Streptomyces sp. ISL-66]|uniref:HD domain-containing protein n=1 Tax=Streptomyces sp. ISL-66 TaxID=2819186 RepID=UPI001BE68D79|nr:hypothetical protein [Streptomyces sp. ISL-66]MBT2467357.1 hypothetical protein [Streptomyces sp. ISL-66]